MIKRAADCNLTIFLACLFDGRLQLLDQPEPVKRDEEYHTQLKDAWESVYEEFVNLSGSAKTKEYELIKSLTNIQSRLSAVPAIVEVQRLFVVHFGVAHFPGLAQLKKFGYNIYWNTEHPDPVTFEKRLAEVISREKRFVSERDARIKDLEELYRDGLKGEVATGKERKEFLRMILYVGKWVGYQINKNETSVEDFAIMVKDYNDHIAEQARANNKHR